MCCTIILRPPSRHLERPRGSLGLTCTSSLFFVSSSSGSIKPASSAGSSLFVKCASSLYQFSVDHPVEMTALNALSLTIVTGRWMFPEHHVLPRGEGVSISVASNAEAGLLQIQYALPARPACASGDEGVFLRDDGFQRPFDGRHRALRRATEGCRGDCFPMMLSCSLRAPQPACLIINDHTGRGREPEALSLRRRRAAVGDLVSLLHKSPQRTTGSRWGGMRVVVFLDGLLASLLEAFRVLDGKRWALGFCRSQKGTAEEISSFRMCLA